MNLRITTVEAAFRVPTTLSTPRSNIPHSEPTDTELEAAESMFRLSHGSTTSADSVDEQSQGSETRRSRSQGIYKSYLSSALLKLKRQNEKTHR